MDNQNKLPGMANQNKSQKIKLLSPLVHKGILSICINFFIFFYRKICLGVFRASSNYFFFPFLLIYLALLL